MQSRLVNRQDCQNQSTLFWLQLLNKQSVSSSKRASAKDEEYKAARGMPNVLFSNLTHFFCEKKIKK